MSAGTATVNPNIERLANDREPDLERDIGGYVVRLFFTPSLEAPERAVVEVHAGPVLIDVVDVPAEEGYDTYIHTTRRSPVFEEALR